MKRKSSFFVRLYIVIPLIIAAVSLIYFREVFNGYNTSYSNLTYQITKTRVKGMIDIMSSQKNEYQGIWDEEMGVNFIDEYIAVLNRENGVYLSLLNLDLDPIGEPIIIEPHDNDSVLKIFNEGYEQYNLLCKTILKENGENGETIIYVDGLTVNVFWLKYPSVNHTMYVVAGILPDDLYKNMDTNKLARGVLILILLILAMTYSNMYIRHRLHEFAVYKFKKQK
jgi:hypothetical protein